MIESVSKNQFLQSDSCFITFMLRLNIFIHFEIVHKQNLTLNGVKV